MEYCEVVWEGDSLEVIRSFPDGVRQDLGVELRRLQTGLLPIHFRPMPSIGKGVYELKEQDGRSWYRLVYLAKIRGRIYVLHCFRKQSGKTAKSDLSLASSRLRMVLTRILGGAAK